jgi:hypothetical protein
MEPASLKIRHLNFFIRISQLDLYVPRVFLRSLSLKVIFIRSPRFAPLSLNLHHAT